MASYKINAFEVLDMDLCPIDLTVNSFNILCP